MDTTGKDVIAGGNAFNASDGSRLAFTELLALCRREKIAAVLLATPDAFLDDYAPEARRRMDDFLCGVGQENDVPLIDAGVGVPGRLF